MSSFYFKYTPIVFLIFLDYLCVILSIYLSASSIVTEFIPFLNLFIYYSFYFFLIAFLINYKFNNYTYLNRTFGLDNIKNLLFSSLLILLFIYLTKFFLEVIEMKLYFFDNYFLSNQNIINQVTLFSFFSIIVRFFASKLSNAIFLKKKNICLK